jgi:hypothetical protein
VKRADPNGDGLPSWPKLDPESKQIMVLDGPPTPREVLSTEKLALFEQAAEQ